MNYSKTEGKSAYWLCLCECGKHKEVSYRRLTTGNTRSCGCLKSELSAVKVESSRHLAVDKQKHTKKVEDYEKYSEWHDSLLEQNIRIDNTSGVRGVKWSANNSKWRVSLDYKGTRYNLGCYDKLEDAKRARIEGEVKYVGRVVSNTERCDKG